MTKLELHCASNQNKQEFSMRYRDCLVRDGAQNNELSGQHKGEVNGGSVIM